MNFIKVSCLAVSTAIAFASCSNDDAPSTNQLAKQVHIRLLEDVFTKGPVDQGQNKPATIFGNNLEVMGLTAANAPAQSAPAIVEMVNNAGMVSLTGGSEKVRVRANYDGLTIDGIERTAKVNTRQGAATSSSVLLEGVAPITTEGNNHSATVTLIPEMSRFEVVGTLRPMPANHVLTGYQLTAIYLNNIKDTRNATALTFTPAATWDTQYGPEGPWSAMCEIAKPGENVHQPGPNQAYGFSFFPQSTELGVNLSKKSPHLIFKFTKDEAEPKYINVRYFTSGAGPILNFQAGNIYSLNLSTIYKIIEDDKEGGIVTPTPDPTERTVSLGVTIQPWSTQAVLPGV